MVDTDRRSRIASSRRRAPGSRLFGAEPPEVAGFATGVGLRGVGAFPVPGTVHARQSVKGRS